MLRLTLASFLASLNVRFDKEQHSRNSTSWKDSGVMKIYNGRGKKLEGHADGVTLPRKCFISHAYLDAEVRDRLIATFPPHVEPFVFPPITVSPDRLVSTPLIEALLGCDGVIYLRGVHLIVPYEWPSNEITHFALGSRSSPPMPTR